MCVPCAVCFLLLSAPYIHFVYIELSSTRCVFMCGMHSEFSLYSIHTYIQHANDNISLLYIYFANVSTIMLYTYTCGPAPTKPTIYYVPYFSIMWNKYSINTYIQVLFCTHYFPIEFIIYASSCTHALLANAPFVLHLFVKYLSYRKDAVYIFRENRILFFVLIYMGIFISSW